MRLKDADRLDDVLEDFCFNYNGESDFNVGVRNGLLIARYIVQGAPTIDAEPVKHAHWMLGEKGSLHCSHCDEIPINRILYKGVKIWELDIYKHMKYCPKCGAKMDLEE